MTARRAPSARARLTLVNIFAEDIERLARFYVNVFGFREVEKYRAEIFRAVAAGPVMIGINSRAAYELLDLSDLAEARGTKFMLNFDVETRRAVDRLSARAVKAGAILRKAPYLTYYGWYQAVLLDPEGNVLRVNHVAKAKPRPAKTR